MTTKREKGNRFQVWVRDLLISWGWTVRNFPMLSVPVPMMDKKTGEIRAVWLDKENDVWGADLIARKDSKFGGRVLWIQATLDTHVTRRQKEFAEHFSFLLEGEELQLWSDTGGRKINIKMFYPGEDPVNIGKIHRKKFQNKEGGLYGF